MRCLNSIAATDDKVEKNYLKVARDFLGDYKDYINNVGDIMSMVMDFSDSAEMDCDLLYEACLTLMKRQAGMFFLGFIPDEGLSFCRCDVCLHRETYEDDIIRHIYTKHAKKVLEDMFKA